MIKNKYDNGDNYGTPFEKWLLVGIVAAIILAAIICASFISKPTPEEIISVQPVADITDTMAEPYDHSLEEINADRLQAMADAFAYTESRCKADAYSAKDNAVGILQITPVMVAHFNEIMGACIFDITDMYDPEYSRYVFDVVQLHDNPVLDIDSACDVWNPRCPKAYRDQVKKKFNENIKKY